MLKNLARDSFISLLGGVGGKAISFLYSIAIARLISQENIGVFYFTLSIFTFISFISTLGLHESLSRYIPYLKGKNRDSKTLVKTVFVFLLLSGIIFSIMTYGLNSEIAAIIGKPEIDEIILKFSPFLILFPIFAFVNRTLQGMKKIKEMQIMNILNTFLKFILTLGLLIFINPLDAMIAGFLIPFLLLSIYFSRKIKIDGKINYKILGEVLPFGFTFSLLALSALLMLNVDRFMLGFYSSFSEVGAYSIIVLISNALLIFSTSVVVAHVPNVSFAFGKNREISSLIDGSQRWSLYLTMPFIIIVSVLSEFLLSFLYGEQYVFAAPTLAILLLGITFKSASLVLTNTLISINKTKFSILSILIALVINIILNLILIPEYSIIGAAIASTTSFIIVFILDSIWTYKFTKFVSKKVSLFLTLFLLISVIYFIDRWIFLALASTIYFIFLIKTGKKEAKYLLSKLKNIDKQKIF